MKQFKEKVRKGTLMLASVVLLGSCANTEEQSQSTKEMMMDADKQNEVMEMITHNPDMMNSMMGHMMKSDSAMMMMSNNMDMMKMMHGNDMTKMMDHEMMGEMMNHMMQMMEKDSSMCKMMGQMMMSNDKTKGMMMEMMQGENNMDQGTEDHESHH